MYVKEISLEGFKSYAQRTVVSGFDPFFNAITGLNGSGKSNILDSICFVLGITNLQQVRATNLQELVYKQGQAGVTKATVSILFDNSDRSRSPIGYEEMKEITVSRQIVVGGRNKYMINGHVKQPAQVHNLFHSVQLNVNNPHFLIMQGRITKVLNMKPPEILSMLEEAAGTKMYESKKEVALKTLEKKQTKVDDIDNLLKQDILPALEKLRKERGQYHQWMSGKAQLDRLERFCIAFEYSEAERIKNSASDGVRDMETQIQTLQSTAAELEQDISVKETEIASLTEVKEKEMSSEIRNVTETADKLSTSLVTLDSALNAKLDICKAEKTTLEQLKKNKKELESSMEATKVSERQIEEDFSLIKDKMDKFRTTLESLESEYQGILAGKASGADDMSLADQLSEANSSLGKAASSLQQCKMKIEHLSKELVEKQEQFKSKQHEVAAAQEELKSRKADLENLKAAIEKLGYREGSMEELEESRRQKIECVKKLKTEVKNLTGRLSGVEFSYDYPGRGFERSRVKGVVARLVRVKEASAMTALEVIAGGKIFFVIVDSDETAKLLLEKGNLQRRTTIIPMNKIQSYKIPERVEIAAGRLVGDKAKPALSLVEFQEELETAMSFVFGSAFVCSDTETAKQLAFHKEVMTKSVTYPGDVFEPRGLLTGGSRKNGGELLMRLHALAEAEASLSQHEQELVIIEGKIESLAPLRKKYAHLMSQMELKSYDLSLYESRAEQSEHFKLGEEVASLASELGKEKLELRTKEQCHLECSQRVTDIDRKMKEQGRDRDAILKDLEKRIKLAKKEMVSATKDLKDREGARERMGLEKEAAVQELSTIQEQLSAIQSQIKNLEDDIAKIQAQRDTVEAELLKAKGTLAENRKKMKECDVQIGGLVKQQNQQKSKLTDCTVEIKKLQNEIKRMEVNQKECDKRVERLLEKHEWIAREKHAFGKVGADYDFSTQDPATARQALETLQAQQKDTEKRINKKALTMFDKAEEEYNDLIERKRIVQNDKAKIQQVIKELDEKRKEQLKNTWEKVTKEFGSIFSTLLPGTMAKLEPPEGSDVMDGLEVKVAFGTVWKQSLSELSGGQRSLLALSLILALLLFKPAPLYILDEVDAALDLSHTQNIGRMIKSHFPHSQFIVVSLKEGMFNNANVIFRTKFVDGVSTVTRTAHGLR
ncbi:hypothetical protein R1sor_018117 [Riccia sorocarpa]|uniref:Structural maintenance of chromosomes protein n=1 Tax=Riccia sorocarpa TaxID=122646 RepID=A0ABD3I8R8_9MARC